jgi:hypothetical protein
MGNLFFKLRRDFAQSRQATDCLAKFADFNGVLSERRVPDGTGRAKSVYAILIPAGRRPESTERRLGVAYKDAEFSIVEIDPEGFEIDITPEVTP